MAHFAKINNDGIVEQVIVVDNDKLMQDGIEKEENGINFIKNVLGLDGEWIQTSRSQSFRGKFAGIGFYYDKIKKIFIEPKPYDSWIFDETTNEWKAPSESPGPGYIWNESSQSWICTVCQ